MKLTEREKQILQMLCLPNKEIAERLNLSVCTIKSHVIHLSNKFSTNGRINILMKALKENIVKIEDVITGGEI